MPTFKFSKLVRDKIVDDQIASGAKPVYRQLDEEAHKQELIKKLAEEAQEIAGAPADELVGEIADVKQVLEDLCELYGVPMAEVAVVQSRKRDKSGAFRRGLYVEQITVNEDNKWTAYYRANADRYPEIT